MSFSQDQLATIVPFLKGDKLKAVYTALSDAMSAAGITDLAEVAAFIAQIAHESGSFFYTKELASGAAYEGRKDLGNTQPGDGIKFKGRGWIQITGRANYTALSKFYNMDFITHPELLETPQWCAESAIWFWETKHLGAIAKLNTDDSFELVTRRINGGVNGLDDRRAFWLRAKKAFGI